MRLRKRDKDIPGLNTSSTADISFMLLIFFLVTTSMDTDKGLRRVMPEIEKQETETVEINKSTVFNIAIDADNSISVNDSVTTLATMREEAERFIASAGKEHVICIDTSNDADYDTYFHVQNELIEAYKNVRNAAANKLYGKRYTYLKSADKDKIIRMYPQRITEKMDE